MSEVYLPVSVDEDEIAVDFDGAPWMYVDKEPNVWDGEGETWVRDSQAEADAIARLEAMRTDALRWRTLIGDIVNGMSIEREK